MQLVRPGAPIGSANTILKIFDAGASRGVAPRTRILGGMEVLDPQLHDAQLSDVVLFELPTFEAAQAFRVRLRPRWPGWSHDEDQLWLFAAEIGDETDGLALLLREGQEVLTDLDLLAIVFVLDGRSYVLAAAEPAYERTAKQALPDAA